ncbi:MAG: peptide ABC transporter substrate-binding protein [Verrucomicrobiales bacterium]
MNIPESDWRRFKEVHGILIQRYCSQVLEELLEVAQGTDQSPHDRYLKIFGMIRDRDKELGRVFDDFRRSTAVSQLGLMRSMGLLADEELASFSEETRQQVDSYAVMASRLGEPD